MQNPQKYEEEEGKTFSVRSKKKTQDAKMEEEEKRD